MAVSILVSTPAWALNLEDCLRAALEKNGGVNIAAREREKAELMKSEALGRALPNLDLSASYIRQGKNPEIEFFGQKFKLAPDSAYQAQASLTQYLYSGALASGYRASKRMLEAAGGMEAAWRRTLTAQVKAGFYAVLFTREMIGAEEEAIGQLKNHLKDIKDREAVGMDTRYDVMRLETRLAEEAPRLIEAKNAHAKAVLDMQGLMGMDPMAQATFEGSLERTASSRPAPAMEEAVRLALERRPEIAAAKARARAAAEIAEAAKSERYPTIKAFANYKLSNTIGVGDTDKLFDQWNFGVSLDLNIFDGAERSSRIGQRMVEAEIERIRLEELERGIKIEALAARDELSRAEEFYKSQEKSVEYAGEAYRIAKINHQEGMITQLELLDAQMALTRAGTTRLRSLFEYASAAARLSRAMGEVEEK
jgi:outer membrane protein TolC